MKTVTVDVRPDIQEGREPFSRIMNAVDALGPNDSLLLIAPFQPVPLFRVMSGKGFTSQASPTETGDWEVLFTRKANNTVLTENSSASPKEKLAIIDVDARGLEPPQPLVKILEVVQSAPHDSRIEARTDRRPMHLYSALEERGWQAESKEESDGSFLTIIRRIQAK